MRSFARFLLPMCVAPLLGSCYFLLDYSDLQGGTVDDGAAGMKSGAAGAGGNPAGCPGDCDDHDPCTTDRCDEPNECVHTATEGLALDGFEATLLAEQHVRVSLVGSGQLFYLAAFEINGGTPKVSLYRLASDGDALETIAPDLGLEGAPISNVGLAVEELPLGEVALHGFVAIRGKGAAADARVVHVVSRGGKIVSNIAGVSYRDDDPTVFPQALRIGNEVIGAWIQADGTIGVHNVGNVKTDTLGISSLPATSVSLLSTADEQPAVMFTAQAESDAVLGTYVETAGKPRVRLPECETRPGNYLSSTVIGTQIPGVWLANITRAGEDYLTSGGGTIVCGNGACTPVGEDCKTAKSSNGVRDVAGATVRFDGDPPGIVYSVLALPQIAAKPNDAMTIEGTLGLALGRIDFSTPGKADSTTIGGDVDNGGLEQIARIDTSEELGFAGPDWPAVSILPTKQVAVAWIQPNAAFDGTELHVQRYKMCLPSP